MVILLKLFMCFILYSIVGWVYETVLCSIIQGRVVSRGFLYGPLCPIYGFGALAVFILLKDQTNIIDIFLMGGFTACAVEYFTSWIMEKLFHSRWWDYSERLLNINGRVCLTGFLVFGAFSVAVIFLIQPKVWEIINGLDSITVLVFGGMLLGVFIIDVVFTVFYATKLTKHVDKLIESINEKVQSSSIHEFVVRVNLEKEEFNKYVEDNKEKLTVYHLGKFLRTFPDIKYKDEESLSKIMHEYAEKKKDKDTDLEM